MKSQRSLKSKLINGPAADEFASGQLKCRNRAHEDNNMRRPCRDTSPVTRLFLRVLPSGMFSLSRFVVNGVPFVAVLINSNMCAFYVRFEM